MTVGSVDLVGASVASSVASGVARSLAPLVMALGSSVGRLAEGSDGVGSGRGQENGKDRHHPAVGGDRLPGIRDLVDDGGRRVALCRQVAARLPDRKLRLFFVETLEVGSDGRPCGDRRAAGHLLVPLRVLPADDAQRPLGGAEHQPFAGEDLLGGVVGKAVEVRHPDARRHDVQVGPTRPQVRVATASHRRAGRHPVLLERDANGDVEPARDGAVEGEGARCRRHHDPVELDDAGPGLVLLRPPLDLPGQGDVLADLGAGGRERDGGGDRCGQGRHCRRDRSRHQGCELSQHAHEASEEWSKRRREPPYQSGGGHDRGDTSWAGGACCPGPDAATFRTGVRS